MKICFISSETLPFSKTGGLADVVYGLSGALAKNDNEVTVISPLYNGIDKKSFKKLASLPITLSWRHVTATIYETFIEGVRHLLVENSYYFERPDYYGYDDDIERFAFFDLTFIELVRRLNYKPDIVHVHDWQTAMIPLLLREAHYNIKTVLTIHNPAFQGNDHESMLGNYFNLPYEYFASGLCRFHDYASMLKTGIVTADLVTTVSKTHAKELLDDLVSYNELGQIIKLRKDSFVGITNGIDVKEFDPSTDKLLEVNYDLSNVMEGKKSVKEQLEKYLHLSPVKGPTFGIVSRLTDQKGLDKLNEIAGILKQSNSRLIIVGSGQRMIENLAKKLSEDYPENFYFYNGYSSPLAHLIYAASDFFLMPSRYEPCGIGQLIAKRYGSLPIVSNVGGLYDTVIPFDGKNYSKAEGIRFDIKKPKDFVEAIKKAIALYKDPKMLSLIHNAMQAPCSWDEISLNYLDIYKKLL